MRLGLLDILKNVFLTEDVSPQEIQSAIENNQRVLINYVDAEAHAPKKRVIEPYVYGMGKWGHELLRVYQSIGDTWRGNPKYKTLRVDRIKSWKPTQDHFYEAPQDPYYNEEGDKLMTTIYCQAHFHSDNEEGVFDKDNTLDRMRKKTKAMQKSTPINISQLKDDDDASDIQSPPTNEPTVSPKQQDDSERQKMIARNMEITRKEKAKRGRDMSGKQLQEPIVTTPNSDTQDEPNVETETPQEQQQQSLSQRELDFQKMLQRNLEITRQEKAKRGFSLDKIKNPT